MVCIRRSPELALRFAWEERERGGMEDERSEREEG
jgi:hypothetical protein